MITNTRMDLQHQSKVNCISRMLRDSLGGFVGWTVRLLLSRIVKNILISRRLRAFDSIAFPHSSIAWWAFFIKVQCRGFLILVFGFVLNSSVSFHASVCRSWKKIFDAILRVFLWFLISYTNLNLKKTNLWDIFGFISRVHATLELAVSVGLSVTF